MSVSIHRRAAHIHAYMAFVDGFEKFLIAGKGIGKI
jgi:hypothetical protein